MSLGRVSTDVAGKLRENVPVAAGYGATAVHTLEDQVFAVGNTRSSFWLGNTFRAAGLGRFSPPFCNIRYLPVTLGRREGREMPWFLAVLWFKGRWWTIKGSKEIGHLWAKTPPFRRFLASF